MEDFHILFLGMIIVIFSRHLFAPPRAFLLLCSIREKISAMHSLTHGQLNGKIPSRNHDFTLNDYSASECRKVSTESAPINHAEKIRRARLSRPKATKAPL